MSTVCAAVGGGEPGDKEAPRKTRRRSYAVLDHLAVLRALLRYWLTIRPRVGRELRRWERRAERIPDPVLREQALANLRTEALNPEAAAVFATLAPLVQTGLVTRLLARLQVICDYADTVGEQPVPDPFANNLALQEALSAAIDPAAPPADHYRHNTQRDDGGYLDALLAACREDVDLANGRIFIGRSKTQAGLREIDLAPVLRDALAAHKARAFSAGPDDLVFPTGTGGRRDKDNLRNRVLATAIKRADELLQRRGQAPLPHGLTPHKLRHTFASVLIACGEDPASVMAQLGHTDPKFTLRVYTHMMRRDPAERTRLKALMRGDASGAQLHSAIEREALK